MLDNNNKAEYNTYCSKLFGTRNAEVAELADALDSKSSGKPCRFESGQRHKGSDSFRTFLFQSIKHDPDSS